MADKDEAAAAVAGDKTVDEVVQRLLDKADASGAALLGEGGLLTEVTKAVLERALEAMAAARGRRGRFCRSGCHSADFFKW
ncbi:hypothetical protein JIW86_01295 [Streptomyces sp. NBC_00162]|nr:hypothetical protein [Streptomyces sp. NBC_00162]UUU37668.1 hypothetical protein JIW86_01295 [Streptomyces sp. NBC_00162]